MFIVGEVYSRSHLHSRFGGQLRNRISTPAGQNIILLFANHRYTRDGHNGYTSGWTRYGVFRFLGEGRYGHMAFTRGNRALRDHLRTGKRVHLFVRSADGDHDLVHYEGEFVYRGHFYKEGQDQRSDTRRMIVFALKPRHALQNTIYARLDVLDTNAAGN